MLLEMGMAQDDYNKSVTYQPVDTYIQQPTRITPACTESFKHLVKSVK